MNLCKATTHSRYQNILNIIETALYDFLWLNYAFSLEFVFLVF